MSHPPFHPLPCQQLHLNLDMTQLSQILQAIASWAQILSMEHHILETAVVMPVMPEAPLSIHYVLNSYCQAPPHFTDVEAKATN